MINLPISTNLDISSQETVDQLETAVYTEINDDHNATKSSDVEDHTNGLIGDLAWILLLAAIVTLLFKKLKQPVVLGYILAGFLASPKFEYLPSISNLDNIEFWADLGIVVLMFTLGLEFSFKKLMNAGSSAIITALIIITWHDICRIRCRQDSTVELYQLHIPRRHDIHVEHGDNPEDAHRPRHEAEEIRAARPCRPDNRRLIRRSHARASVAARHGQHRRDRVCCSLSAN